MANAKAKHQGILAEQLGDEIVVYDQQRKTAHRLNKTVALVWQNADGTRSISDLVTILKQDLNEAADENLVLLSLDRLDAVHLLEESPKISSKQTRTSRREFVRKVGAVGVLSLLLPLITTMAVPTPAEAQTGGQCQTCNGAQFCSCTGCGAGPCTPGSSPCLSPCPAASPCQLCGSACGSGCVCPCGGCSPCGTPCGSPACGTACGSGCICGTDSCATCTPCFGLCINACVCSCAGACK